jgi:hypothetical protein
MGQPEHGHDHAMSARYQLDEREMNASRLRLLDRTVHAI